MVKDAPREPRSAVTAAAATQVGVQLFFRRGSECASSWADFGKWKGVIKGLIFPCLGDFGLWCLFYHCHSNFLLVKLSLYSTCTCVCFKKDVACTKPSFLVNCDLGMSGINCGSWSTGSLAGKNPRELFQASGVFPACAGLNQEFPKVFFSKQDSSKAAQMLITTLDKVEQELQMTAKLLILLEIKFSSCCQGKNKWKHSAVAKPVRTGFSINSWKVTWFLQNNSPANSEKPSRHQTKPTFCAEWRGIVC